MELGKFSDNRRGPSTGIGKKPAKLRWIVGSLALCLFFLALSAIYLNYVREAIRRDAKGNLAELGNHIAQSLYSDISGTTEVLGSLALEVSRGQIDTEEERVHFLSQQSDFWNFYDLALIDQAGISHHQDGSRDTPLNRKLLSEATSSGNMTFDFLIAGGKDSIIFYVPLPREAWEPTDTLAISGTYAVHNWDLLMDINLFQGQAVTQIITKEGVVITRSRENTGKPYYNLLDTMRQADFEADTSLEQVRETLLAGESLHLSYQLDGTEYYLICSPIGFNDWSLAFTVPTAMVNSAGDQMARSVLSISAGLTLVYLLIFILFRTSQARAQKQIWIAAYVDEVTGGANRHKFTLDAQELLAQGGVEYMLAYSNIDQFKLLNQRYGSTGGDHILRGIHAAFQQFLSERECCARLTADHFVFLLARDGVEGRLAELARQQTIQTTQDGGTCQIRLTFGLCPVDAGDQELTAVIDRANLAMKTSPMTEHGIAVYSSRMMEQAAREKALTERLLQPSVSEEFTIHLQPKVGLSTGTVIGAEALARWTSPEFGPVSPGEFIPLAEKAGVILSIDLGAFECVCRMLAQWMREDKPLIPISFNLSKAQLAQPNFLDLYREVIARYQIPCQYLDFEFTESLLYENSGALQQAVAEIHAIGASCSVDDFGFGYSSLGLLGQFEADTLKLDRSFFMEDAQPDSRNNRIVQSVIQMANSLGMHTVAEGVEDKAHVEMLRQFGCGSIQGYYYSKPLPLDEFDAFTARRKEENKR